MQYVNGVSTVYIRKFARKLEQYNRPGPLPEYFREMIGDKTTVSVAEVGAGPICTLGREWPGVDVQIVASDVLQPEYEKLWKEHNAVPLIPIWKEDMERLSYPDNCFDVVHCVNALDHTKDARAAVKEMQRVCAPGGWVYLRHAQYQLKRFGGRHYWNIYPKSNYPEKTVCCLESKDDFFWLEGFKSHVEGDLIVSLWQKT